MDGATSLMLSVTAWLLLAPDGSAATTLKLYELFASKFGEALIVTAPVELLIEKDPASAPESDYVTVPPAGSDATAV